MEQSVSAMEHTQFPDLVSEIKASRRITADDVIRLRQHIYGGRTIARAHIEELLEINRACADIGPEWIDLFAEAMADFLVEQQAPQGYVDDANADWLIAQVTRDGRIDTATELEAIVAVMQKARKT